jgi:hypothetical protein
VKIFWLDLIRTMLTLRTFDAYSRVNVTNFPCNSTSVLLN